MVDPQERKAYFNECKFLQVQLGSAKHENVKQGSVLNTNETYFTHDIIFQIIFCDWFSFCKNEQLKIVFGCVLTFFYV